MRWNRIAAVFFIMILLSVIYLVEPKVPFEKGGYEVYFCPQDNCTHVILENINESDDIRCAIYDLDLPQIIDALEQKNASVVMEEKNQLLQFQSEESYGLMHNKFCVLDSRKVITGSMNPTENGAYRNNNNLLVIESRYLAENYQDEFDELYAGNFGDGSSVIYPKIILNNITIQNYFCPEDNCQQNVIKELQQAEHSIYFMFFSFTDRIIADTLIQKHNQGLDVRGIMEKQRINMPYNLYKYINETLDVKTDNNPYIMHHKVFIIDNQIVITGSYNPTKSGNLKNDENLLIIRDPKLAKRYIIEFESLQN